jgi:hypothetical protein
MQGGATHEGCTVIAALLVVKEKGGYKSLFKCRAIRSLLPLGSPGLKAHVLMRYPGSGADKQI